MEYADSVHVEHIELFEAMSLQELHVVYDALTGALNSMLGMHAQGRSGNGAAASWRRLMDDEISEMRELIVRSAQERCQDTYYKALIMSQYQAEKVVVAKYKVQ